LDLVLEERETKKRKKKKESGGYCSVSTGSTKVENRIMQKTLKIEIKVLHQRRY
jgi:hypothetical protein